MRIISYYLAGIKASTCIVLIAVAGIFNSSFANNNGCLDNDVQCLNKVAVQHIVEGEYQKALDKFMQIKNEPWLPREYYRNRGTCQFYLKKFDEAEESYRKGIRVGDRLSRLNLAYLKIYLRKFSDARKLLAESPQSEEETYWTDLFRGYLNLQTANHRESERILTSLLSRYDSSYDAYLYRAHARYRLRKYKQAKDDLNRADLIIPGNKDTRDLHFKLQRLLDKSKKRGY